MYILYYKEVKALIQIYFLCLSYSNSTSSMVKFGIGDLQSIGYKIVYFEICPKVTFSFITMHSVRSGIHIFYKIFSFWEVKSRLARAFIIYTFAIASFQTITRSNIKGS